MMRNNRPLALVCALLLLLVPLTGCKSEEQIAEDVQSTAAIRDVVYNEAEEVLRHTIVVQGSGEVKTVPDSANITFSVSTKEKEATAAQAKNEETVNLVISTILSDGVLEKDVKTTGMSLHEQYDYSGSEPKLTGYEASSSIDVTIREVENLGSIIANALEAGVTNYYGLSFSATDTKGAYEEALKGAVRDAQAKGEAIAEAAEREILSIMSIEEQSVGQGLVVEVPRTDAVMEAAASSNDVGGISTGEITTSARVKVTYEIQ